VDGRTGGTTEQVTALLEAARGGDDGSLERLLPVVYADLRAVAEREMRREAAGHTLQPTALVHEAYLRLAGAAANAGDRTHFLAIAARAMRQVLVDHARRRDAAKRGGGAPPVTLTDAVGAGPLDLDELLALDRALDTLDPRKRQVVECRFFAGMEESEIATALGLSERTVRRDWAKARAWLYRELYPGSGTDL
jgi:RNA polymerase sigma factor (TIGR02999 family)